MAKELPYFKFEPSEWLEGQIQICSDTTIVCFTNLLSGYWLKLGCISYAFALHKYCRKDESILNELVENGIISINDESIVIKFLDDQLNEFQKTSEKRRNAANKRWNNASALQVDSKSNAIREDKRKGNKSKKEIFDFKNSLIEFGFNKEVVSEWLAVRKNKKATNTKTAFDGFIKEVEKSGKDKNEILKICVEKSWSGFNASWLNNTSNGEPKSGGHKLDTDIDYSKAKL